MTKNVLLRCCPLSRICPNQWCLCWQGVEATLFATLMSILNGGAFAGSALGSALTAALGVTADDFRLLWVLIAVCQLSSLLPLPLLWCEPASA